jgi:translocation and assembly module TamA
MIGYQAILFMIILAPSLLPAAERIDVVVRGPEGSPLENVRKALAIPYGIGNGTINTFWLDRYVKDVPEKARRALEPYGYYHAEISTSLFKPSENMYRLVVSVNPGRPIHITEISVAVKGPGGSEQSLSRLASNFPLRRGDILLQPKYEQAKAGIRSRAVELGYLDADFTEHVIAVDPGLYSARINLVMETGPLYRFKGVTFEGAPRYPVKFLNRFLSFKPGDVFSYAKLGETQINLINSERFREVIPVPQKSEARDNVVPVVIRLGEAPAKRLRPGLGYATDIGPRLSLEYSDLNVNERGQEFRGEFTLSKRLQNLGAGYVLPGADINTSTGLQINIRREDVTTYTTSNVSAELNRTMSIGAGRLGTAYLRFEREKSTVALEPVDSRLVLPGIKVSGQRFDSLIRPTKGRHYNIDLRGTHQAIGSNNRFFQVVAEGSLLVPLPWRLSIYSRAKAGVTFQNAPVNTLPVSYRFFAGGDRSVRGYGYQSLGPEDEFGRVVGGKDILVGSLELNRALLTNWGLAVFYDVGNAFNSFTDIDFFRGAGVGIRYYTMLGAIRLDIARQISVPDPSYRLHLTLGLAF